MNYQSVFIDEAILEIHYIPDKILHRDSELQRLRSLFDNIVTAPYEMSQKAVIVGNVGSGKTVLANAYGRELREKAERRKLDFHYIHVNCRQRRGSLFMVLSQVVTRIRPDFPERGYSANELLDILRQILDEEETQILLVLDEVDALINNEGSDALYYLTRFHETTPDEPRRLNLLCISKDAEVFRKLDKSTLSSLQRNIIRMPDYNKYQLADILRYRMERAFRPDAVPLEIIDFISEVAEKENGDARQAISILHGAGLEADNDGSRQVKPEHARRIAVGVYDGVVVPDEIKHLSQHEKLTLLGISRFFLSSTAPEATTGEIEESYHLVCEEYYEKPRGHTQFWKYLKKLDNLDFVSIQMHASSQGRTQHISLDKIPAKTLQEKVEELL
ncbi:MAG: AAA family ATPase [Candidatus Bathyarchaeota archaeon]|nr:AAA family ATPase [Candidatus Bathyarchaeota archaeon]